MLPTNHVHMRSIATTLLLALAALPSLPTVSAHSWIEEFQVIDTNGTYIDDRGYPRGYMARTDASYNGFSMDYLVPQTGVRINSSDLLCHPAQQTSNYSNPAYPKLKVTPGSYVAMKYLENGHVTLPWNQLGKPAGAGTVLVYGTTKPSDTEKIADVLAWTSDGTGGNGNGFLMTAQNFDDGRCHQINCGNISTDRQTLFPAHVAGQPTSSVEQWCETDLKIPESQASGSLTVYWVWQWPTAPNQDCTYPEGKDEYYTTCSDFEVVASTGGNIDAAIRAEGDTHTLAQENPQSTAVSAFQSRTAFTTSPPVIMVSGTKAIGQSVKVAATFESACSVTGNVAPSVEVPSSCDPITIFTGAALASALQAVKQYATTTNLAAAAATASPATSSQQSLAPTQQISAPTQTPNASRPSTYTITSTTTVDSTLTTTVTTSSPSGASTSSDAGSIAFSTLSTVSPPPATSTSTTVLTPAGAPSSVQPAPNAPTVAANGMVEDVVVGTVIDRTASELIARHAHRRHARHFA